MGVPAILTWQDSFGRSRLQIILSVRNDDTGWVRFPREGSTYQVLDGDREVASRTYFALPAVIGPGETAFLVDTLGAPGVELRRGLTAVSDVVAVPTDRPTFALSITDLRLTSGLGGALRATGEVRNDSESTTGQVVAGAIALDRDGAPLAVVFDTFDVGRLDPGATRAFVTDTQPGGPPVIDGTVSVVVGVAFDVGP
ncbi:MAG: hypothetical protein ABIQ58_07410 [Candidatus Limnocylindrales bacterium]